MEGICMNFLDPVQFFWLLKGRCHGNQFSGKITYTPALIALSFQKGMGYRYLNVRINSINNASISYENFVKFGPATSELTELICKRQIQHGQKTGTFLAIFSPYESALRADDGSVPFFPIFQGTLLWQPNNIVKMLSTLRYHLHSLH